MSDTTTTERAVPRLPAAMPVGGNVAAIVPQSFEEIQRVANTVIVGGIAPSSLIKWPGSDATPEEIAYIGRRNVAAVAGVLMAGAELGVPPMAALRMFTSINGKPALYADGNIAVARRAKDSEGKKIAASIQTGCELIFEHACPYCSKRRASKEELREHITFAHKDEDPTEPGTLILSDHSYGWCEAKRADTGEVKREEFSISDAKLARLWDEAETVEKYGWHTDATGRRVNGKYTATNDSPWHRYWKRMLRWRAIGYCLRELFADVLAGMLDEFEAREIEGLDFSAVLPPPTKPEKPTPPTPPPAPEEQSQGDGVQLQNVEHPEAPEGEQQPADPEPEGEQHVEEGEAPAPVEVKVENPPTFPEPEESAPPPPPPPPEAKPDTSDAGRFLSQIDDTLRTAGDHDELERLWDELDVQNEFSSDDDAMTRAFELKKSHTARIERLETTAAGQSDIFGGQ